MVPDGQPLVVTLLWSTWSCSFGHCMCQCLIIFEDGSHTGSTHKGMKRRAQHADSVIYNRNTTVPSLDCARAPQTPSCPKQNAQE